MDETFPYPSVSGARPASQHPVGDAATSRVALVGVGHRACCCPGWAVVQVIMPATAVRPHKTELFLCGHHYRVSRRALAEAHATVCELPGTASDTAAWLALR
jgi:hypothetical protein